MKVTVALLFVSTALLNACEEKKAGSVQSAQGAVISVTIANTVQQGQPVAFEMKCGTPTPCWEFKRLEIMQDGFVYTITAITEYDGRPCVQILGSFTTNSSVVPKEKGTYTFRFWRAADQFLERSVVVR